LSDSKGLSKFFSATIGAQALAAITGLLLARWLSVDDYAIYTVMTMMMGAMMVLTKGGVNLGLNAVLGRVWPNLALAKGALTVSLQIRKRVAIASLPIVLSLSFFLLFKNGAGIFLIILMLLLLVAVFIFDFNSRLHDQIITFANRAHEIQIIDCVASGFRLLCIGILKPIGFLSAGAAIFVATLSIGLRVIPIRRLVASILFKEKQKIDASDVKEIKSITKRQYPIELFYVFQAQIVLVLLAVYGESSDTAVIGALGRIGQLYLPVMVFLNAYSIPRFARVAKHKIVPHLIMWSAMSIVPGIFLCTLAIFSPEWLLFLVGENYANYQRELLISCIFFAFSSFSTCVWQLLANRGLNKYSFLQIPVFILWCLLAPLFLDLTTLVGVLWFQLGFPIALLVAAMADLNKECNSRR
jgi:O-antigen/teichoic acid export membrane protein